MPTPRVWGGTTLADRQAERRQKLVGAGVDLLGEQDGVVSVRAACRRAKLTERYFYESFADRDALLIAVYEHVAEAARDTLVRAVARSEPEPEAMATAAVTAFVELILDDPRLGRVLLLGPMTEHALYDKGFEFTAVFAALIREHLSPGIDADERDMIATSVVGAFTNLFISYLNGTVRPRKERLVAHCVRLLLTIAEETPGA
ncbi:TetR family transcriptional regulator [Herbihabitans rhizosphaerae]|uniref:TetR family transcriptional regulator n=1 Tax=Herbihabitans rhizosphaerae TaxID=1872711 RepID=A0A4Q7L6A0_9PSEU|nr:TetR/AcrR family transcriptional regulator [Herbihabitans rhizosphaerae]RZS44865.1 TetR family transcriptional regulator [Herbihabitans rhizosphaerae]